MARVLRIGSGRAVLLVTQPHLLGLPELQREPRKKKNMPRSGHEDLTKDHDNRRHETLERQRRERCRETTREDGGGGGSSEKRSRPHVADQGQYEADGHDDGAQIPCGLPSAPVKVAAEPGKAERNAPRGALWRIKARHAVNVGGLISWLVVLDRTCQQAPPPKLDRRKGWVGLNTYCKRKKEEKTRESAGS